MGETERTVSAVVQRLFARRVSGARVNSDSGLILVRELDERLGLSELVDGHLSDSARSQNTQLPLADWYRSRSMVAWRTTKTLTTPSASLRIRAKGGTAEILGHDVLLYRGDDDAQWRRSARCSAARHCRRAFWSI